MKYGIVKFVHLSSCVPRFECFFLLDGDETADQRASKVAEKVRRHALSSSAMQGLKEEFMDTPVEIVESSANISKMNIARERQERQE